MVIQLCKVSIHAPTRGATVLPFLAPPPPIHVSIHAPTRGATIIPFAPTRRWRGFQSTHPHGVRQGYCTCFSCFGKGFNPRTHTGCDAKCITYYLTHPKFQSTHPHGVRRSHDLWSRRGLTCFNPRTHTGCDLYMRKKYCQHVVSIHAPTRGATVCKVTYYKSIN